MLHNAAGLAEAMQCSAEADIMAFPLALHALPSAVTLIAKHNSVCFPVYVKSFEEGWGRGIKPRGGKSLVTASSYTDGGPCLQRTVHSPAGAGANPVHPGIAAVN